MLIVGARSVLSLKADAYMLSFVDPSQAAAVPEYVRARALWAVSHVGPILVSVDGVDPALLPRRHALARSLFEALARAVAPTEALIVRLQATRTFGMSMCHGIVSRSTEFLCRSRDRHAQYISTG